LAQYLASGGVPRKVTGVDLTEAFIARAKERAKAAGIPTSRLEYLVGDAYSLPLADASCEATLAYNVISILERPLDGMREMRRVTRPGGRVAILETTGMFFFPGVVSFPGAGRLWELDARARFIRRIRRQEQLNLIGKELGTDRSYDVIPSEAYPHYLEALGLEDVHVDGVAITEAPDDPRLSDTREERIRAHYSEMSAPAGAFRDNPEERALFEREGMDESDMEELDRLSALWLEEALRTKTWLVYGGTTLVTSGVVPSPR
jgi:SAM-dependent methyltransferase